MMGSMENWNFPETGTRAQYLITHAQTGAQETYDAQFIPEEFLEYLAQAGSPDEAMR